MTGRGRLLGAGARRAAAEAALAAALLTLPLLVSLPAIPTAAGRWPVATLGFFYAGLAGGLVGALRLRRAGGGWPRQFGREVALAALFVLAIWAGVALAAAGALALVAPALGLAMFEAPGTGPVEAPLLLVLAALVFAGFAAVGAGIGHVAGRGLALAWTAWDRRRRTRLLWALTHAQLVAGLVLALGAAAGLAAAPAFLTGNLPEIAPDAGGTATLARLVVLFLPAATVLLIAGVAAVVVVLPPVALISFLVLRRATRRLEDLATAADALRAGDLAARVPVAGADEVARLQATFNAMAADLARAMDELRAERDAVARLLAARRDLVAAVSHELRTPVATLRAHLDAALAHWETAPPPTLRDDLAVMAAETERLGRLIDDLFMLARAEVGGLPLALRPTDVGEVLRRAAAAAAPPAWQRGRVAVLAETPPDLPPALADPDRLEQVVRNLVANAVRHTPPGGLVLLAAAAADGTVVVQVKDTGEGIPAEDLPHVFERFYRAGAARERDRGGAGLGLALVKELTEAMGGRVGVESTVGAGSTFTLRLPAA